jgi:hypothetical protein
MSQIPNHIQIGPVNYKVEVVEDLHTFDNEWKKQTLLGHIIYSDGTIKINKDAAGDVQTVIVWHEVLHGIFGMLFSDHDEALVESLSYALVDVIRRNPALMAYTVQEQEAEG